MPAGKAQKQKKGSKASKKPAKKPEKKSSVKAALKASATKRSRARPRAEKQPAVRKDETTIKLGPHHVERHPVIGGVQVRPAPVIHQIPAARVHHMTTRHH